MIDNEQLLEEIAKCKLEFSVLARKFIKFTYSSEKGREFATQGLLRRIHTIERCVSNIFDLCPPAPAKEIPDKDTLLDVTINIQALEANIAGCVDNIAWIWVEENGILYDSRHQVDLYSTNKKKKLDFQFSNKFNKALATYKPWYNFHKDFRDALLHRIPLYIAPFSVDPVEYKQFSELEKQAVDALLVNFDNDKYDDLKTQIESFKFFVPVYQHSFLEESIHVLFYGQSIADFKTVLELSTYFYDELVQSHQKK